ncbi:hypothetical protein K4F52_009186 [Lecanicillium sp. MT-2017a]|nr:hypothetical protein K4F52_009186 [Lecanicillium sp. MT-2017a]
MEQMAEEERLLSYAFTPDRIKTGMVRVKNCPKLTARQQRRASSLGRLDRLPVEVLHMVLEELDFQSLSRVSRSSWRGEEVHAPDALRALGQMQLLPLHSAAKLHETLRSDECVSCGGFGFFLFLINCQRSCWECLNSRQAMWVMPRNEAGRCFNLSAKQLKTLPSARSVPGKYIMRFGIIRSKPQRLVSVHAAKSLAVSVHGSEAALTAYLEALRPSISEHHYFYWTHVQRAKLKFEKHDPVKALSGANTTNDYSNGMASILFPVLSRSGSTPDHGAWCRGCQWIEDNEDGVPDSTLFSLAPGYKFHPSLWANLAFREWSKDSFLEHAQSSYRVKRLEERSRAGIVDSNSECLGYY